MNRLLLLAAFSIICNVVNAQTTRDTSLYRIETIDGNEYVGTIVSQDNEFIILNSASLGEIKIRKTEIKKMTTITREQVKDGMVWFENPQATRYFWQPNGFGLKKGEGYYQNVWIFFNQFALGITDNLSIGAGIVPLFLFAGASTPVWLTPKLSIPVSKDHFNLGLGALTGTVIGEPNSGFGIVYGTSTFGNRDSNLSIGVGYGYVDGDWADVPAITLSGFIRTGQRGYLMTENYYIGSSEGDVVLLFFGGRRLIKNSSIDFGLMFPANSESEFFAIPWLGFAVPFGKKPYPAPVIQ